MKTFIAAAALLAASIASADVLHVELDDVIHPVSDEYLGRALDEAAATNASAVVVELRTPGGLETSMRKIVEKIIKSRVPVLMWVGPSGSRAASAGFFILEAADIASMAPGTNTGAAHPVLFGEKMDDIMKTKMQEDAAALIRSLAQRRGRGIAAAESGVRQAKSFTEDEALRSKLIEVIAVDVPSLLRWADGRTVKRFDGTTTVLKIRGQHVRRYEVTLRQRLLSWIMDPNIAFVLLVVGAVALFAEFKMPGAIVPGVIGGISILLAIFALNLLPTRFAAIALILAAFVLFALEAKLTSYGVLGTGGVLCLVLGAMLLVDGPIPELRVKLLTAIAVSGPIGIITVFLMALVLKAHKSKVVTGSEAMIGEIGVARTTVDADGKVFVRGELWNASARTSIAEGSRVRVRDVEGLRVMVEPAD